MNSCFRVLIFIQVLFTGVVSAVQAQTVVEGVRLWQSPDSVRVVFDVSEKVSYSTFFLDNPERLVIDIKNGVSPIKLSSVNTRDSWVKKVRRSSPPDKDTLRVVLDLEKPLTAKDFSLAPYQQYGHRLVVDLSPKLTAAAATKKEAPVKRHHKPGARDIVIVIDAGHGGEDPGALGPKGSKEKDVNLAIAKELANQINKEKGMVAKLTRTGDYYIPLKKRTDIARTMNPDLFVSIHADGFHDPRAKGASVWVLSGRGASSEMGRWLEKLEDSSDLLGGAGSVSLQDKDPLLAEVLLDLSMTHSREASHQVAKKVLHGLKNTTRMHKHDVQYAGFRVLKSPDIPSILVETAFISNPVEEKNLNSKKHHRKLSRAIVGGIKSYFSENPVPGALFKPAEYIVQRGDTLSGVALKFDTSVSHLKEKNQLTSDQVRIGQVLKLP
tara:strand:+ start:690 stop:2006 length:1317 start_codon:yes stop_codon:yes gene_type:complete